MERQKLLFLTKENPFPAAGGAHIRDSHLIRLMQESMDVEVLCYAVEGNKREVGQLPSGVTLTEIQKPSQPIWERTLNSLRPEVQSGFAPAMLDALRTRAAQGKLLWISRLVMGKYLETARRLGFRTILDQHQVETTALKNNFAQIEFNPRSLLRGATNYVHAAQCGPYERKICKQSDAIVAASDLDASRLLKLAPGAPVHIIPHSVDCESYAALRGQQGTSLLFTGALNHPPNVESLEWFIREVKPRIDAKLGPAMGSGTCPRIVVAGSNPSPELAQMLEKAGVELHANPPSLLPFLADAAIAFIPLRYGRSMRMKVLEAMACGRAVVCTPRAADGLLLSPGYDVWIADGADKFATAIIRLIDHPELRAELGTRAAQTVDARYDWRCARPLLDVLFQKLVRDSQTQGE